MPTINTKPFDQEMLNILSEIRTTYHARELSEKKLSDLPKDIYIIEEDDNMAGYAVVWTYENGKQLIQKAEQDYFSADERYLEKDFYIELKNKKDFVFIQALDIMKEYERKGYAKFFVDSLKAKNTSRKMYVYSMDKSKDFWFKQGFEVVGSTMWMSYN